MTSESGREPGRERSSGSASRDERRGRRRGGRRRGRDGGAREGTQREASPREEAAREVRRQQEQAASGRRENKGKSRKKRGRRRDEQGRRDSGGKIDLNALFGRNPSGPRHFDKNAAVFRDRPKWAPPAASGEPLPAFVCAICGRPIEDPASAIFDQAAGGEVHFDCAHAKIGERERLGPGEFIAYIGGGRAAVLHNDNPEAAKKFQIRKIIAVENPDERAGWRRVVADHYSNT